MAQKTIAVLDPTAKPRPKEVIRPHQLNDLNGKVVGFLWNTKPNGDILLLRIKEQLSQRYRLAGTEWREKGGTSVAAEAAIIEALVKTSDVVVNAIGD